MPFPAKIKTEALAKSGRRCCLCLKFKGVKIEVHHIVQESISNDNSLDNAITLCFDCHADAGHYNPKHPKGNKLTAAELRKSRDRLWRLVEEGRILPEENLDSHFLNLMRKIFDRPAFTTPFRQEGRMEDFEKAIDDTVLAINTGVLRTRDNQIIQDVGFGKASLANEGWQEKLTNIEGELLNLRHAVAKALAENKLKCCHAHCYCGDDNTLRNLDKLRVGIIDAINAILDDANIGCLPNTLKSRM